MTWARLRGLTPCSPDFGCIQGGGAQGGRASYQPRGQGLPGGLRAGAPCHELLPTIEDISIEPSDHCVPAANHGSASFLSSGIPQGHGLLPGDLKLFPLRNNLEVPSSRPFIAVGGRAKNLLSS